MDNKKLERINELARKSKTEALTAEEIAEQKQLREEYIEAYRKNLRSQLDNVYVLDENGKEIKLPKKENYKRSEIKPNTHSHNHSHHNSCSCGCEHNHDHQYSQSITEIQERIIIEQEETCSCGHKH